jgi:hypothetical protein
MHDELGLLRGLVGVIDASEVLNEASACLLIQALRVTALGHLQGYLRHHLSRA